MRSPLGRARPTMYRPVGVMVSTQPNVAEVAPFVRSGVVPAVAGVVGLFGHARIVMVGEPAPSSQLGLLVQRLVPHLHAAGVRHLGIWWALRDDQTVLDRLVTAPNFDEGGACWAVQRQTIRRGDDFAEYVDLVRATWAFNRSRPSGTPPMRLMGLDAELDLDAVTETADLTTPQAWPHLRPRGSLARRAAEQLVDDVIGTGGRALVVVPTTHAVTSWRRPRHPAVDRYDVELHEDRVMGLGNHLFAAMGDGVATVLVLGPVPGPPDGPAWIDPLDGALAAAVETSAPAVPALLPTDRDLGIHHLSSGWSGVTLDQVAAAWLIPDVPSRMRAPTPIRGLVHDANIDELRRRALDPTLRAAASTPVDFDTRVTARIQDAAARWRAGGSVAHA